MTGLAGWSVSPDAARRKRLCQRAVVQNQFRTICFRRTRERYRFRLSHVRFVNSMTVAPAVFFGAPPLLCLLRFEPSRNAQSTNATARLSPVKA
jgi:hypothetical protein